MEEVDLFNREFPESSAQEPPKALSVSDIVRKIRNLVQSGIGLCQVEGEVSNLRRYGSGHWYFSLKDEQAQIACVMFHAARQARSEVIQDGAKIKVEAEAGVYQMRGQLQLVIRRVEAAGEGELQARFEALKRKLEKEGLFQPERKQELPRFPRRVGIITSLQAAALQDILNVLGRRAPWVEPVLFPVPVQGKNAYKEIAEAVRRMGEPKKYGLPICDVIIVGRGGGSLEDLWNFNEEELARAIAMCPIPIISAVGHEIDFTIVDFVADQRAPTPSAAAELAVPDAAELRQSLQQHEQRIRQRVESKIEHYSLILQGMQRGVLSQDGERLLREPMMRIDMLQDRIFTLTQMHLQQNHAKVSELQRHLFHLQPGRILQQRHERISEIQARLEQKVQEGLQRKKEQCSNLGKLLHVLGPQTTFERGFSLTMSEDGKIIRSLTQIHPGMRLRTQVMEGEISSEVIGKKQTKESNR